MILLLGGSGQIGLRLRELLAGRVLAPSHGDLELRDTAAIEALLRTRTFEAVINAAGYTDVARAELEEDRCLDTNTHSVLALAHLTARLGLPLVHYSSDYVFDGQSRTPYSESAGLSPLNSYGRSKALVDQGLKDHPHVLVIRTSWVFDERGTNFFSKLDRTLAHASEVRVVRDQIGSPTWARDLARVTLLFLERGVRGFVNFSSLGEASWFELAEFYLRLQGSSAQVVPVDAPSSSVRRPAYSVLDKSRAQALLGADALLRPWQQVLTECFGRDHADGDGL